MKVLGLFMLFMWCLFGQICGQELKNGYYPDGKLRYKGHFVNGKPQGEMIRYYPEGSIKAKMNYRGDTVDAVLYNRSGDYTVSGKYFRKMKCGLWKSRKGEKLVAQEEYRNDRLNGKSLRYTGDGKVLEEKHWKDGRPEGIWKLFFPDGQLKLRTVYVGGELEGEMVSYFPEGKLRAKGKYKHNVKEGVWEFYNVTGELVKKLIYKEGKLENEEEREMEEPRQLDALINSGKKIPDPAVFVDDPEAYMKITGME